MAKLARLLRAAVTAADASIATAALRGSEKPLQYCTNAVHELHWVFLGAPGVGKGTYSTRIAEALNVPHIAAGDLVRAEISSGSSLGQRMASIVNQGNLLPDGMIIELIEQRLQRGRQHGETGFILDGFPRTVAQAHALERVAAINLAVNLSLREEVLVAKCLGRRICKHCGKNYNVADIHLPAANGRPEIVMPPLRAPPQCEAHLQQRDDDTEAVVLKRLEVYRQGAAPVEDFYRQRNVLLDFEITAGIPETMPRLLNALKPHLHGREMHKPVRI